jgi:hypothetical protein
MVLRRASRADAQRLLDEYRDDTEAVLGRVRRHASAAGMPAAESSTSWATRAEPPRCSESLGAEDVGATRTSSPSWDHDPDFGWLGDALPPVPLSCTPGSGLGPSA